MKTHSSLITFLTTIAAVILAQQQSYADITGIGDGTGWTFDGYYLHNQWGPPQVEIPGRITLLAADRYSTKAAFYNTRQNITSFSASFVWWTATSYDGYNPGDGFTFVVQNAPEGPWALGGVGGTLGYQPGDGFPGVYNSIGLAFNEQLNSIALVSDAVIGSYTSLDPVVLHSNHQIKVDLQYDGTTLTENLTDLSTGDHYSSSSTVNIPDAVGGNTAYVGFTAASGYTYGSQFITSFSYTSVPEPSTYALLAAGGALLVGLRNRRR